MSKLPSDAKLNQISQSYDEVPYVFQADTRTYPGKNAALAWLYGLDCKPLENCRILELGCAQGANIIPIAESFPDSKIIGVDISQNQIAEGQTIIKALNLKNIELIASDFQTLDLTKQSFDYIIAHGIFSWVPKELQKSIIETIKYYLAPKGLAHVSFNVMPGWSTRLSLKDYIVQFTKDCPSMDAKLDKTIQIVSEFNKNPVLEQSRFMHFLKADVHNILKQKKGYIAHEFLETCNNPVYYYEFFDLAQANKLQVLGEAQLRRDTLDQINPQLIDFFKKNGKTEAQWSQLYDFVSFRTFRNMLICHDDVVLSDTILPSVLTKLYFSSKLKLEDSSISFDPNYENTFGGKGQIQVKSLISKTILMALQEAYPKNISLEQILEYAVPKLEAHGQKFEKEDILKFTSFLLYTYTKNQVDFWVHPLNIHTQNDLFQKPKALALNRFLVKNTDHPLINHHHEMIAITPDQKKMLTLLDGTRSISALQKSLNWAHKDVQMILGELAKYVLLINN